MSLFDVPRTASAFQLLKLKFIKTCFQWCRNWLRATAGRSGCCLSLWRRSSWCATSTLSRRSSSVVESWTTTRMRMTRTKVKTNVPSKFTGPTNLSYILDIHRAITPFNDRHFDSRNRIKVFRDERMDWGMLRC